MRRRLPRRPAAGRNRRRGAGCRAVGRRPGGPGAPDPDPGSRPRASPHGDDLRAGHRRQQLPARRPLAGHQLLRRHPAAARLRRRTPRPRPSRSGSTPACARSGRRSSRSSSPLASPTGAHADYTNEWADGLFDAALRYRQRQVNTVRHPDRHRQRRRGRQPRPADRQRPRDALRRQPRRGLGHQHPELLRAAASSPPASTIPTRATTRCRAPRSRARATGTCSSTRCSSSQILADLSALPGRQHHRHRARHRRGHRRRRLPAERELPAERRHRLGEAQALRHHHRRPRDHPEQHRPLGPRRLQLRHRRHDLPRQRQLHHRGARPAAQRQRSGRSTSCPGPAEPGGCSRTTPAPTAAARRRG